jgi:hypothetical protein
MLAPPILQELAPIAFKAVVGLVLTGLLGVFMWPFRKAQKEWIALKNEQATIHQELVTQRTNCLTTLQSQGDQQVELLKRAVGSLENVALSQAEMTGFFRATYCTPRVARARKK